MNLRSEKGATVTGYAFLVSLIAIIGVGAVAAFSNDFQRFWCEEVMKVAILEYDPATAMELPVDITRYFENADGSSYCAIRTKDVRRGGGYPPLYPIP